MKKNLFLMMVIVVLCSLFLGACAAHKNANFPTGKFIKSGTTNHGYIFNADGTWSLFDGMFTVAKGTYSVDGDVYTETSNDTNCGPVMSFTYTFDGKDLTFNYVGKPENDTCINRTWDMNNVTYTLVK